MNNTDSFTILGFDHGLKKTGVARVDSFVKIVEPIQDYDTEDQAALIKIIEEHKPEQLVVGLPRSLDGNDTDQTRLARKFAKSLEKTTGLPVKLQDEALTSEQAKLSEISEVSEHSIAASIILDDYIKELS